MKQIFTIIGILAGSAVLIFVLGSVGGTSLRNNPATHLASPSGTLAPDFSLPDLDGSTITLSQYRGQKPVVVDFWASWCPNCRRDMPNLSRLYEKYKDQVEVIGVNLQERESTVKNFIQSRGIAFPIALDPQQTASRAFGIRYTNTHFLIDKNGNIIREIPGDIRESDFEFLLQS